VLKLVTLVAGCGLTVYGAVGLADGGGRPWASGVALAAGLAFLLLHIVIC